MKTGILLTNIGTPSAPTSEAVKEYLNEFLSDPRVVQLPRWIWWPILHGYILRTRPQYSAKLYQKIWTENGSPLLYYSRKLARGLQDELEIPVVLGMHYGSPSIKDALEQLRMLRAERIIVLPLYPQYSDTTTAATFDAVKRVLRTWYQLPDVQMIAKYAEHPLYIQAIADSIRAQGNIDHLLFSFHGIPERNAKKGDPYPKLCRITAQLVAQNLNLDKSTWSLSFQSRLGRAKWLGPYTDTVLQELPKQGIKNLHVVCPGFAVDCLETLEEIAIRGKDQFFAAGGETFHYIPALNDSPEHITILKTILLSI